MAWNPEFRMRYGVTRNGCYVPSMPTSTGPPAPCWLLPKTAEAQLTSPDR
jgi:hypothetical protein